MISVAVTGNFYLSSGVPRRLDDTRYTSLCDLRWIAAGFASAFLSLPLHAQDKPRFRYGTPPLPYLFPGPEQVQPTIQAKPPKSPSQFNPDPGHWDQPAGTPAAPTPAAAANAQANELAPDFSLMFPGDQPLLPMPAFEGEKLDPRLSLPRRGVKGYGPTQQDWGYPKYPLGREGLGVFPYSQPKPNRWLLNFPHWQRYLDPAFETPYQYERPLLWHPYLQSTLKGDVPIIGQDIFLDLTAKNFTFIEGRKLPVGSGVAAQQPNASEVFGRGNQLVVGNDTSFSIDFFKGETAFKPIDWAIRVTAVYNNNWIWTQENNLLNPNPLGPDYPALSQKSSPNPDRIQAITPAKNSVNPKSGDPGSFSSTVDPSTIFNYIAPELRPVNGARALTKTDSVTNQPKGKLGKTNNAEGPQYAFRHKDFVALQEAFAEVHFTDISDNYDFISSRFGIQPFVSDFRGFIFDDTNLAARIFGNLDNNRIQYNLAFFDMREKDTNSGLNEFDSRDQRVFIANIFKQDFLTPGYTAQLSFHGDFDDGRVHYDKNGFLTRPTPIGSVRVDDQGNLRGHQVNAYYLGWTGDGHIGRFNITHAFYEVLGRDTFNSIAGRPVTINAQMAALELSYDRNWIRFRLSGFYASGSSNPTSGVARGFDSIMDNPSFIGGPFSWYVHEAPNLAGTAVNLKQNDSLVPDLRTSKSEDQANFVNPGAAILGFGIDADVTPKLKLFSNINYIWLAETAPIKWALHTNETNNKLGLDLSLGFKYRPLLTDNIVISLGGGLFIPGQGYKDIYRTNTLQVSGYNTSEAGKVDPVLYNAIFRVSFVY